MITKARMRRIIASLVSMRNSASDEQAYYAPDIYPAWKDETAYAVDDRISYGGKLYKCVQAHTSQSDWTPDVTPALWVRVSVEEFPEWIQPTGAHDTYALGAKVSHLGKHWVSTIDNNPYEPSVYGWNEVA